MQQTATANQTHQPSGSGVDFTGKSVDEAVHAGLEELGLTAPEAEVTVLDKGSRGFLGMGARAARVRIEPKTHHSAAVKELAVGILSRMGIEAKVEAYQRGRTVNVSVEAGDADGLLIGRKGETLQALQHVLLRMAGRQLGSDIDHVRVDVAGYLDRREKQLRQLAESLAERVERSGKRTMTEPLSPPERRVVHRVLEGIPGVRSHAGGSGINRRVVITPAGERSRKRSP